MLILFSISDIFFNNIQNFYSNNQKAFSNLISFKVHTIFHPTHLHLLNHHLVYTSYVRKSQTKRQRQWAFDLPIFLCTHRSDAACSSCDILLTLKKVQLSPNGGSKIEICFDTRPYMAMTIVLFHP